MNEQTAAPPPAPLPETDGELIVDWWGDWQWRFRPGSDPAQRNGEET
jgi:hypothetical protein